MRAVALAALALVVAGCGSPDRRADPVARWVRDFRTAARAHDCKRLRTLAPSFQCGIGRDFRRARAVATARFGPGAVVDYRGVRFASGPQWPGYTQMVLVRGPRGWIASTTVTYGTREVGTRARSVAAFADAALTFNAAVAEGDCRVAFDYTVSGVPRSRYCKTAVEPDAVDHRVMAGNPPLALRSIGGTADVQFFRSLLRIPKRVDHRGRTQYVTIPVIHTSRQARAHGASNPYLVGTAYTARTPADVAAQGPYPKRARTRYVSRCTARGGTASRCACEVDMIAALAPHVSTAVPGITAACSAAQRVGRTADERAVAHVALGRYLVPGYLCSPDVSTDYLMVGLGGSRYECARRLGGAAPDPSASLIGVSVRGRRATATGIDRHGPFTLLLVRHAGHWLVNDFGSRAAPG